VIFALARVAMLLRECYLAHDTTYRDTVPECREPLMPLFFTLEYELVNASRYSHSHVAPPP